MGAEKPTAAEVRRLLDYDQETGVFRWKVASTKHFGEFASTATKGGSHR